MTRSPLFYPLNRGMDADAGGAADLQTDVMRFMAILSLCLVAIFALVQSIPLAPTPVPQAPEETAPETPPLPDAAVAAEPAAQTVGKAVELVRPERKPLPPTEPPVALQRPKPVPMPESRQATPAAPTPAVSDPAPPAQEGFTLRFESDAALTRLVARDVVGLYALTSAKAKRMNVNRGEPGFWPASAPSRVHEMDETTVPANVIDAYHRSGGGTASVKWGVTLPASMSQELDRFLREHRGGALIIGADGRLRMER